MHKKYLKFEKIADKLYVEFHWVQFSVNFLFDNRKQI